MARREEAVRLYDERFAKMLEFYLAASEMSFRKQNLMNFQIQLTRRQGVVPVTRDYIGREEARLRSIEHGQRPRLRVAGEENIQSSPMGTPGLVPPAELRAIGPIGHGRTGQLSFKRGPQGGSTACA